MKISEIIKLAKRYRGGYWHRWIVRQYARCYEQGIENRLTRQIQKSGLL